MWSAASNPCLYLVVSFYSRFNANNHRLFLLSALSKITYHSNVPLHRGSFVPSLSSSTAVSTVTRNFVTTSNINDHSSDRTHKMENSQRELLDLNQKLLVAIMLTDYKTYDELCSDDMTCIEPESNNQVVAGKPFHKFYFDFLEARNQKNEGDGQQPRQVNVSMCNPHVRLLADNTVGVVSYIRLNQSIKNDVPVTTQSGETRVWEKRNGKWVHSHFHRS